MNPKYPMFRVWDEKAGAWFFGMCHFYHGETVRINGLVFQQFTGMSDRNGKPIYDGDIVEYRQFVVGLEAIEFACTPGNSKPVAKMVAMAKIQAYHFMPKPFSI